MTATSHPLAAGPGWRVDDVVCTAGPQDRRFEEQHAEICVAVVTAGSFQYRTTQGAALLAPGSLLLGNAGHCFECGHEHGVGDRCLAFHFAPDYLEEVAFPLPSLPPLPGLMPLIAAAEAARDEGDPAAFEELALRLAGGVAAALAGSGGRQPAPSRHDERRVTRALRRIEAEAQEPLSLSALAREAAMSPYHFLRTFRAVVGMTPHQYLLRTRLHRAAVRLRRSGDSIAAIAFDSGFNDLSTFNHRFRRVMGLPPGAYRARA